MDNYATSVLRWFFDKNNIDEAEIESFLTHLEDGLSRNIPDAFATKNRLLNAAYELSKGSDSEQKIESAISSHLDIEDMKDDIANLNTLQIITDIAGHKQSSKLAERVASLKIDELVKKLI